MINIIVSGAAGKMGSRIVALAHSNRKIKMIGALENKNHPKTGSDAGQAAGIGNIGITISADLNEIKEKADVIIDFSTPESSVELAKRAAEKGIAMVIGTTGLTFEQTASIKSHTHKIPCVLSPNMSVGVNLLLRVLHDVAAVLGDDYDVEVIEAHHRLKKDAPSGTAIRIAQALADALHRDLEKTAVYTRKGIIGERTNKEIGIQTIRAGDIVGEHTVLFGGIGERIEITHKASSRDTFAAGAIKAAIWISVRKQGFYDMQDVLDLKR
ncbi:MAG: 4-hydroxy-tetrahydrodipicolinate reductase [Nitrospirae bacterium]|nr:4-hydroxy-tetrahydrodipicolinate reductase [Nitrospirota bacterium]